MPFRFGKQDVQAPANGPLKPGFRAALRSDGVYELLVYEEIGENWWDGSGITAKGFKQELDGGGTYARIALRINSPGGDAFEGVGILNMLRAQGKPIDVYVDGLAASAASIIAMAGDTITMGSGAMMMIHNAWGMTVGNAAEHQKQVNALSAIDLSIAQAYADRTGQKLEDVKAMMDAETWMGAAECIAKGFATGKSNVASGEAMDMARGFQALKRYSKVPKELKADGDAPTEEKCACDCQNCKDGDCENCANAACGDENCEDCPIQKAAKAQSNQETVPPEALPSGALDWFLNQSRAVDFKRPDGSVISLRRCGSAVLNLAPAGEGKPAVARVTGLLAPYNAVSSDLGGFVEVYQPGCFNRWLAVDDPRVLSNHNIDHVLGRVSAGTARFWDEADGLHYEADLPDTQAARDLKVSMERGDIKESSAAFYILDSIWENRSGVRTRVVKEARLVEGSPHSFAAYPDSTARSESSELSQSAEAVIELEHQGARLRLLKIA